MFGRTAHFTEPRIILHKRCLLYRQCHHDTLARPIQFDHHPDILAGTGIAVYVTYDGWADVEFYRSDAHRDLFAKIEIRRCAHLRLCDQLSGRRNIPPIEIDGQTSEQASRGGY